MTTSRFAVRVKPRARTDRVGGTWGSEAVLIVATRAPAVDGKANEALIALLASELHLRRSQLTIVGGGRGRDKLIAVEDPPLDLDSVLCDLRSR